MQTVSSVLVLLVICQRLELLCCRVYAPLAHLLSIGVSETWDLPQDKTLQMGVTLVI